MERKVFESRIRDRLAPTTDTIKTEPIPFHSCPINIFRNNFNCNTEEVYMKTSDVFELPKNEMVLNQAKATCNIDIEAYNSKEKQIAEKSDCFTNFVSVSSSGGFRGTGSFISSGSPGELVNRQPADDHLSNVKRTDWDKSAFISQVKSESENISSEKLITTFKSEHLHSAEEPSQSEIRDSGSVAQEAYHEDNTISSPLSVPGKTYKCGMCEEAFDSERSIFKHWCSVHSDSKQAHECKECGKVITTLRGVLVDENRQTGDKTYTCIVCRGPRNSPNLIEKTLKGKKTWVCKLCSTVFGNMTAFVRHEKRGLKCKVCQKQCCHTRSLTVHLKTHFGKGPLQGETCGKMFTKMTGLAQHRSVHTGAKPFGCDICGKAFRYRPGLCSHMANHKKADTKDIDNAFKLPEKEIVLKQFASEGSCNIDFEDNDSKEKQIAEKSDYFTSLGSVSSSGGFRGTGSVISSGRPRELVNRQPVDDHLSNVKPTHWDKSAFISQVKSESENISSEKLITTFKSEHLHNIEEPAQSEIRDCGSIAQEAYHDEKTMCSPPGVPGKTYKCGVCKEAFDSERSIFKHWCSVHSDSKQAYECKECGKVITTLRGVLVDENRLTGDKTYTCIVCRGPRNSPNLIEKTLKGKKTWVCKICSTVFGNMTAFVRHEKRGLKCKVCQKQCCHTRSLTVHMKAHFGKCPLQGETCGKRFTRTTGLAQHRSVHTGAKPYGCDICGKAFRYRPGLCSHMTFHTNAGLKEFGGKTKS